MKTKLILGIASGALALALAGGAVYAGSATSPESAARSAVVAERPGNPERQFGGRLLAGALIRNTAEVTGQTPAQVLQELQAGKSLAQIAQAKGKTADDVVKAARTRLENGLTRAVGRGRITRARADELLAQFDTEAPRLMSDTGLGATIQQRVERRQERAAEVALVRATANVTGLTVQEVRTELRAGKSIAQIAQAKGKTADDVLAELRKAGQERLDGLLKRAQDLVNQPGLGRDGGGAPVPSDGPGQ